MFITRRRTLATLAAAPTILPTRVRAQFAQARLALVLAVDVSGSINDVRYNLQKEGILDALVADEILDIIEQIPGGIMFSLFEWGSEQYLQVPWVNIRNIDQAVEARNLYRSQRRGAHGEHTHIGRALLYAQKLLGQLKGSATRMVVDVSGDGDDNQNDRGHTLVWARRELIEKGVTINGLPILVVGDPQAKQPLEGLDTYYREKVIGGEGSFCMPAHGFRDFARAIKAKMGHELSS